MVAERRIQHISLILQIQKPRPRERRGPAQEHSISLAPHGLEGSPFLGAVGAAPSVRETEHQPPGETPYLAMHSPLFPFFLDFPLHLFGSPFLPPLPFWSCPTPSPHAPGPC